MGHGVAAGGLARDKSIPCDKEYLTIYIHGTDGALQLPAVRECISRILMHALEHAVIEYQVVRVLAQQVGLNPVKCSVSFQPLQSRQEYLQAKAGASLTSRHHDC